MLRKAKLTKRKLISRLPARYGVIVLLVLFFAGGAVAIFHLRQLQPTVAAGSEATNAGLTDPSVATDERNNIEVYKAVAPGVVFITTGTGDRELFDSGERQGAGSGCVLDTEGHILTNDHVVAGARQLTVSFGGDKTYSARVVGRDPDTDLAVIKTDAPRELLKVIELGDSDALEVGQKVLAIGNPFGLDRTITTGIISGLQRPIRARNGRLIEGAIQTDASINPGNSGGPLLDSRGRIIGINSQILSPAGGSIGVGFAIPVSIAKRVVPQLVRYGQVNRPRLGIAGRSVKELKDQIRLPVSQGVLILQVNPNGAAAAAGLRGVQQTEYGDYIIGDIVTAIDGKEITSNDDITQILDRHKIGDTIRVTIVRSGRGLTVSVQLLGERRTSVSD